MKFERYFISDNTGKSNCIIRSFCKLYNDSYENIKNNLFSISKKLNCNSYNDIEVFEAFMKKHNTILIEYGKNIKIKDLELDNGKYIVFCWNKKQYYHMVTIINNILYDKDEKSMGLYTISIYKQIL